MTDYSYEIAIRPEALGGGYRLRLLCDGAEVGGGVFVDLQEEDAYDDAMAAADAWLATRPRATPSGHMMAHSGIDYVPGALRVQDVKIEDIAHALSLICRFGGHCHTHYSVVQHSLLVVRILEAMDAPQEALLCGLMHDAHEAYVGDVPTPIKAMLGAVWSEVEHQAEVVVHAAFGLERAMTDWHELIRHADRIALATERRDLMQFDMNTNLPWPILRGVEPHPRLSTLIPGEDQPSWATAFLERFAALRTACDACSSMSLFEGEF